MIEEKTDRTRIMVCFIPHENSELIRCPPCKCQPCSRHPSARLLRPWDFPSQTGSRRQPPYPPTSLTLKLLRFGPLLAYIKMTFYLIFIQAPRLLISNLP